ncbi:uncharacterized protein [Aegilops tauschii subsp. strangulata]|uniref:uncharacterized protein n=1 Tax=Aegilops tauschii subsp. strangulata TaxID=200361 RepID=UPI003CC84561
MLVPCFTANYFVLPASGTRGGMILAASNRFFALSNYQATPGTISASVSMLNDRIAWTITCVYGPQGESEKVAFIEELRALSATTGRQWLLLGDFNLITKAADKSNANINHRLIGKFRGALDFMQLKELRMCGRRFTWSNEQANLVMTKIDHVFHSDDWDLLFPNAHLQAISTTCSDHAPLFLQGCVDNARKPSFKFEEFWLRLPGFHDAVAAVWNKLVLSRDALRTIHIKLCRTAKALRKWQKERVGVLNTQIAVAKEIIWRLDVAEEGRPLSESERVLRRQLKASYLGLLAIQKTIRTNVGLAITTEDKERALLDHFQGHLGRPTRRSKRLAWENIGMQRHDLSQLDSPFDEEEIKEAVFSMPSVKVPGPDGFIGAFFKSCWEIIKTDVVAAILQLADLRGDCVGLINSANIILLPKKADATRIGDYRPISLIHIISKIFSKLLANRLAPLPPR